MIWNVDSTQKKSLNIINGEYEKIIVDILA